MNWKNINIGLFKNLILISLINLSIQSCNTIEPINSYLQIDIKDVSCTEAWIEVSGKSGDEVELKRDDKVLQRFTLTSSTQIVFDSLLLPNRTYLYVASVNHSEESSNKLELTTLDTTNQSFVWKTFKFGDGGNSVFNDVAIISDTLAFAVGEIYLNDPSGLSDPIPYSLAKWDGKKWSIQKVIFNLYNYDCTIAGTYYGIAKTIYAFDTSNIIFSDGADFIKWDGKSYSHLPCVVDKLNGSIQKIWGISSNDFFAVGTNGTIIYYLKGIWQKLESGTSTIITDIWGIVNNKNEVTAYCPVSSFFTPGDKKILKIRNNKVDLISWNIQRLLYSVWTNSDQFLYVCGSGTYENKKGYWEQINLPLLSMNAVRGNNLNDIFVAGDFGLIAHFNGISWKVFNDVPIADYYSISLKGNLAIFTGQENGQGIITIGLRN